MEWHFTTRLREDSFAEPIDTRERRRDIDLDLDPRDRRDDFVIPSDRYPFALFDAIDDFRKVHLRLRDIVDLVSHRA